MCHFRSRVRGFIEELSVLVWHLGCEDTLVADVGGPVRTAQTRPDWAETYREPYSS